MNTLQKRTDRDSRIKFNKIADYLHVLSIKGIGAGEPYIKHIDGDIWERRPLRDRFFFAAWLDGSFVLLHHFVKKTQKTPPKEISQAKSKYADLTERGYLYEQEYKKFS